MLAVEPTPDREPLEALRVDALAAVDVESSDPAFVAASPDRVDDELGAATGELPTLTEAIDFVHRNDTIDLAFDDAHAQGGDVLPTGSDAPPFGDAVEMSTDHGLELPSWAPFDRPESASDEVPLLVDALAAGDDEVSPESGEMTVGERRLSAPLYRIFLSEADEIQGVLEADLADWRARPERQGTEQARRALHSLKGSAAIVGLAGVRALAGELERFVLHQRAAGSPVPPADVAEYGRLVDVLRGMLHRFAAGEDPAPDDRAVAAAAELAGRWEADAAPRGMPGTAGIADDSPLDGGAEPAPLAAGEAADAIGGDGPSPPSEMLDAELLPIFVEEAQDYLPQIDRNLRDWLSRPDDRALAQLLMRQLHTVKGSARMAGAMALGQRVHEMETRVEAAIALTNVPAGLIEELITNHDVVIEMFERVRDPGAATPMSPTATSAVDIASVNAPVAVAPAHAGAPETADVAAAAPETAAAVPATPMSGDGAQAMVRVRADRLDALVNEAGEVSIARSRLENSLGSLRQSLVDLTENVARLRAQLREIEIQAETQIQTRIAQARESHEQFDPLEFDRFTRFQELTRMLAESVNDVATVQHNATRSLDDAGQDLVGQGQVLRALQQNLMRIRMLRFGTLGDRLYRVVRQSAKQLGKRVSLDIRGSAVEIDRSVLERMAAPLEHLLRNAVAHGVEPPADRAAAGKGETGEIRIEVRQEGNEVVLDLRDDGAGLNLERIHARAVQAGLLAAGEPVSPEGLAEMIFRPGFSTASVVDEISGRGVGMDVVRAEVAALGGRVEVSSVPGQGTAFTVRLPLTLAIAQVVMVTAGSLRFAIPSSSIEQVLQLKPQALASAYEARAIDWLGASIPLYYFGSLVDARDQRPVAQHYSPVVVVRAGGRRIAVHVDSVSRNQEVVIKNVGPQVARVRGVGGATVLGNGEIVLILNLGPLAQGLSASAQEASMRAGVEARLAEAPPTVMVVDDSLTVRKFTQRLLQREGYDVMLAKDGVDALRQLQDRIPDAMLVDIEMPRMDGFDLTRHVRADARTRAVPIVMITSRTADKHRNYALSLGVDVFLGKPFDDQELTGHLRRFVSLAGASRPAATPVG